MDIKEAEQIAKWLNTELKVIDGAQHTFGASQPWEKNVLPEELNTVCKLTLDFFLAPQKPDKNNEALEKPGVLTEIAKLVKSENDIRDIEFHWYHQGQLLRDAGCAVDPAKRYQQDADDAGWRDRADCSAAAG